MKQIIDLVFSDMLFYTIGNISSCIFKNFELNIINITARVYKLRLVEVNFLCCLNFFIWLTIFDTFCLMKPERIHTAF